MTDPELAVLTAAGGALMALARWTVGLWATIRREDIAATKETAAQQRADSTRMVEALLAQARVNAELGGKIDALAAKLDALVEWRERTPVEMASDETDTTERRRRPRLRTAPEGYRSPRPGEHND